MKSLPTGMQAHLDDGTTTLVWCWRITRADGQVFGFTDHDKPLTFDGTTFDPESGLSASEIRANSDMSVDAQDAEGALTSDMITETDIIDGKWDAAQVEVWRVNWADTSQRAMLRRGIIGQIRRGRVHFVAEMRSLAHALNQTVGRTFQATCDATLGDARCGVDLEAPAYKGSGSVTAVTGTHAFTASGIGSFTADWFTFGTVSWLTGANAGRTSEIIRHQKDAGGTVTITLLEGPVLSPASGDTFDIRAGCDKSAKTCNSKFVNIASFRGFPNIPGEKALGSAKKGAGNDGSTVL